ncbi:Uncharacterised protein [Mycobacterium tuberculosis]|uniref:Uncharacterized protein n=1 Tax=Mycobacterium tuberculosis TaxID=1773 RepID=A0A0T9DVV7_MYCTX|nr:Uncharacterised protein [Mycobacterium tuberculosis]CKR70062.1 Uncharacterised protein [Mycobacterium tuberculosis]CKS65200.1 Uncharacterised protein [Mycobacterium tuberculosis]CKT14179.1 Uncharacterised protein [Mycobacterium tuberculosis]CKT43297.1 Uncharacterised protein [Mycobacterium tuberculosis]
MYTGSGANLTRSVFSAASTVATCTAWRAVAAATSGANSAWEANPHVPATITRTARPSSRLITAVSSSPSRSWMISVLMR